MGSTYKLAPAVKRSIHYISPKKKIQIILYLMHHRIKVEPWEQKRRCLEGLEYDGDWRPPTAPETGDHFKVPPQTIRNIWANRYKIVDMSRKDRRTKSGEGRERHPAFELELFRQFVEWRQMGRKVSRFWFKRRAKTIFETFNGQELVSTSMVSNCMRIPIKSDLRQDLKFSYSNGWFQAFCRRWDISWRRLTHAGQRLPSHYLELINRFVRFIRRNSIIRTSFGVVWRFPLSHIMNMDEVPIPFEFFDGYTYHLKGEHTVTGTVQNTSWSKRQATLVLYVFADGVKRLPPKLIFHGTPGGIIDHRERAFWDPRVTIEITESAYNNEKLLLKWIEQEVSNVVGDQESLLVMDSATFHKTEAVKQKLQDHQIVLAVVPPGCTGLVQPLDVAINKAFKALLRDKLESILMEEEEVVKVSPRAAVAARRIAVTKAVGDAWDALCDEKQELVQQSFVQTGIAVNPCGADDHLIKIKDFEGKVDFSGWEKPEDDVGDIELKLEEINDGFGWDLPADEGEVLQRQKHLFQLLTVPKLRQLCQAQNLQSCSRLTKPQLIEKLLEVEAAGMTAGNPILLTEPGNEVPPPEIAGQYSWSIEYSREAVAEEIEERRERGEFEGLIGR